MAASMRARWPSYCLMCLACAAASPVRAQATADQLKSFDWWVSSARLSADRVENAEDRGNLYYALAYVQLHARDLAGASESAAKVTDLQKGVYIHTAVASRYHQVGDADACRKEMDAALAMATATPEALTRNFSYSHLIRSYAELGMLDEARQFAERLPPWLHRDGGLVGVATALAEQGRLDEALEIAKNDVSEKSRQSAFVQIARASADQGLIEDTHRTLELVAADGPRDEVRAKLAQALAKAGRIAEAAAEVDKIKSAEKKAQTNALLLAEEPQEQDAEAIAARLVQVTSHEETVALSKKLIETLVSAGKIAEAEVAIQEMVAAIGASPRPEVRSAFGVYNDRVRVAEAKSLYLTVARELSKQGDVEGAKRWVAQAAEPILALAPTTGLSKGMLVLSLVTTQIEAGDLEGARTTLNEIKDRYSRSMPAGSLAAAFAKAGDVQAALEVAAMVEGMRGGKGTYHSQVLEALIERGEMPAVKQLLEKMIATEDQENAYKTVGAAMWKAGRAAELAEWLPAMPTDVARAAASMGAAEAIKPAKPEE